MNTEDDDAYYYDDFASEMFALWYERMEDPRIVNKYSFFVYSKNVKEDQKFLTIILKKLEKIQNGELPCPWLKDKDNNKRNNNKNSK